MELNGSNFTILVKEGLGRSKSHLCYLIISEMIFSKSGHHCAQVIDCITW